MFELCQFPVYEQPIVGTNLTEVLRRWHIECWSEGEASWYESRATCENLRIVLACLLDSERTNLSRVYLAFHYENDFSMARTSTSRHKLRLDARSALTSFCRNYSAAKCLSWRPEPVLVPSFILAGSCFFFFVPFLLLVCALFVCVLPVTWGSVALFTWWAGNVSAALFLPSAPFCYLT